jgi:hypothetical protein
MRSLFSEPILRCETAVVLHQRGAWWDIPARPAQRPPGVHGQTQEKTTPEGKGAKTQTSACLSVIYLPLVHVIR